MLTLCALQNVCIRYQSTYNQYTGSTSLRIFNMRPEDEGEYCCKAFNVAGETTTSAFLLRQGLLFLLFLLCWRAAGWSVAMSMIPGLSLTYKVLTTTQPPYLHNLISVQPPRNTCSSYHVTFARPPTSSSLRITDRCFRYASPCLWNQLPNSLRQPHSSPSVSDFPAHAPATSSYSLNSPLSPSITPSLFHSRLKTYLFHKSFPP